MAITTVNNQQTQAIYPICSNHTAKDFCITLTKLDPNATGKRFNNCQNTENITIISVAVPT